MIKFKPDAASFETPIRVQQFSFFLASSHQIDSLMQEGGRYSGKQPTLAGWAPNTHQSE